MTVPAAKEILRVVIADDRPRTRAALRALLAAYAGYMVVGEAADGDEAIQRVEQLRPDLVVLDVRMPRMDGLTATALIKTRWPAVRVIVHSLAVDCREAAVAAGADAFVPKGGRPDELVKALGLS
jgi:DNA-binding NarL/FixJ family response regulator